MTQARKRVRGVKRAKHHYLIDGNRSKDSQRDKSPIEQKKEYGLNVEVAFNLINFQGKQT